MNFSATMAHEINNPLAIIIWKARILSERAKDSNSELSLDLQKIEKHAGRIQKIIKGIKLLAKDGENEENAIIPLKSVFNSLEEILESKGELNDVRISINEKNTEKNIFGNEIQLTQVCTNLVNNAIDAIKDHDERWINVDVIGQVS